MSKIFIILLIPFINSLFKEHRPVYQPDKNVTYGSELYNTKSRFLDESSSSLKLQFTNPISYQYIISDGLLEYLTFTFKVVNLSSGYYYKSGSLLFPSSSNISIINVEFLEQDTNYTFSSSNLLKFYFKLKNNETLTIKIIMKFNKNIKSLFRSEYIYIPSFYVGTCKYNFEIVNAKNLGLLYGNFNKLSTNSYYYEGDCPGQTYYDYIRTSPFQVTWKAYKETNLSGTKITYIQLTMPSYFNGGNNFNFSQYLIDSTETNVTKTVTNNNTHIQFTYKNISETSLSFKINTTFSNYMSNNWTLYYSDDQIQNISTEKSISLVNEILENDTSSNPSYYKIGKWIYWNIDYNSSYTSKNFTLDEIIEKRIGVCQHFSTLYIGLLNSIGIKAVYIHGFSADDDDIYNNYEIDTSYGHAWIIAYINDKWIGLDATWGIVEGNLPISHLYYSAIYGNVAVSYVGNNVKWDSNSIQIQFVEVVDIVCEDYQVNIDGECMLCIEANENIPYYDVNENKCVSECNGDLYNNICYSENNTNDTSNENNINDTSNENDTNDSSDENNLEDISYDNNSEDISYDNNSEDISYDNNTNDTSNENNINDTSNENNTNDTSNENDTNDSSDENNLEDISYDNNSEDTSNENNTNDTSNENDTNDTSNENNTSNDNIQDTNYENQTEDSSIDDNENNGESNSNNVSILKTSEDSEQFINTTINIINELNNCVYLLIKKQIFRILLFIIIL